ncbi:DNA/RNA non-specific endonuclease [Enterococcus sp. AZ029]|uniref:DNA/RNA non-specific endonuclease n=1 Tax=Enterococcus sp. AZ029 TaxID=2774841 RepID=UPI003F2151B4
MKFKKGMNILCMFTFILFLPIYTESYAETKVNINSAPVEELEKIVGVGPLLAQEIVRNRPYNTLDDLLRVKGIGPKKLEKIKEQGIAYVGPTYPMPPSEDHWLIPDKILKPNIVYMTGEYEYNYKTDDKGRIKKVETEDLQMTTRPDRLPHNPNTLDKLPGDHAGHLIGDRFGGSPKLDNLVSQARNVNLSSYKKLENKWAASIGSGIKVKLRVILNYEKNARPTSFDIDYILGEVHEKENIVNVNP